MVQTHEDPIHALLSWEDRELVNSVLSNQEMKRYCLISVWGNKKSKFNQYDLEIWSIHKRNCLDVIFLAR